MSDSYFCYLKVSGPDIAEFYRLLWKSEWVPRDPPYLMFSWGEPLHLDPSPTGKPPTKQVARIWYNTEVYVIQPRQPRTLADSDTLVNKLSQVVIRGNADSPLWAFAKTKPLSDEQVRSGRVTASTKNKRTTTKNVGSDERSSDLTTPKTSTRGCATPTCPASAPGSSITCAST